MRPKRHSILAGCASALVFISLLTAVLPTEALSPAAEVETRAIQEVARAVQQTSESARGLKNELDGIDRELGRSGRRQAGGEAPGFERRLETLRAEAQRARSARAALGTEALNAERDDPQARRSLRTFHELDQRLRRLEETIQRAAQSLRELQGRMREPEPPRAERGDAPKPSETSATPTQPEDLSGTWIASGLATKEDWQIKHTPQEGVITVSVPIKHLPGRSVEFVGTVEGGAIRATHRVSDPEVLNPKLPEKVRREDARRPPVWTITLQAGKAGTLQGTFENQRLSWNKDSQKITGVRPEIKRVMLTRKAPLPDGPPPTGRALEKKEPSQKGPPEPESGKEQEARRRQAEEAQRQADELHREALSIAELRIGLERQLSNFDRIYDQRVHDARRVAEEYRRSDEEERRRWEQREEQLREERRQAERQLRDPQTDELARDRAVRNLARLERDLDEADRVLRRPIPPSDAEIRLNRLLADRHRARAELERTLARVREDSRKAERAAVEAQRRANELRYGPRPSDDPYGSDSGGQIPVVPGPGPSPPVVRP